LKRILCSLLVAIVPFGRAFADAPKPEYAKVTLVYQNALPNVPGKSTKGVHAKSAFIHGTVREGAIRSQVNDGLMTTCEARRRILPIQSKPIPL
jgi:hypothetical protein